MSAASARKGANAACCSQTLRCSGARVALAIIRLRTMPRESDSHAIRARTLGAHEPLRELPFCCLPACAGRQSAPQGRYSVAGLPCQHIGANPTTPPLSRAVTDHWNIWFIGPPCSPIWQTAARCCCAERQHFLTHLPPIRHRDLSSLGQQGNLMHARGLYL